MLFKKENESVKPKYKATYKSLHSGETKTCFVIEPTGAFANCLVKSGGIWEMYMLTCVELIKDEETCGG